MNVLDTRPSAARLARLSPVATNKAPQATSPDSYVPGPPAAAEPQAKAKDHGPKGWTKAILATSLAASAFAGLAPSAHAAVAAVQMQTQTHEATNGMEVIVLPRNTPRLDIFQAGKRGIDRDVNPNEYSLVGLSLGNGLFQDTQGNLSVVPFLAYDWDLEAKDFQRVDVGTKGKERVQRYGQTVQYTPSSTRRDIYSEAEKSVTLTGSQGQTTFTRQQDGSLSVQTPHDQYTIRQDGMFIRIQQQGEPDVNILRSGGEIRVMEGQRTIAGSSLKDNVITLKTQNGEATITRSASGTITNVDGRRGLRDTRIVKDGDTFLGIKDKDKLTVDDRRMLDQAKARYDEVIAQLEAVEPGFVQKHPLVAEVLEYAAANPKLLTGENDNTGFLQAGTLLSTTAGGASTVSALGAQAAALNLASSARALGAAALSAKAAAQAQAAAGNLVQAASLAKDAQNFATRAHEAKDAAMRTGGKAMKSANLARVLIGVGGALQIVDGVLGYKGGKQDRALIEGARAVTESSMNTWSTRMQTAEDRLAVQDDYDRVIKVMDQLDKQADKEIRVGKLKIGLGGLMVVSSLLGPSAPPILGAIGLAGTVGLPIYEHWGPIKSFLTGNSEHVPTFLDILPVSDEVIIHLDGKPLKRN